MIYTFDGELLAEGQRSFIPIPFNVWEECGVKGNIPVLVNLNDFTYECKLLPKGNGIYYIPIAKANLEKLDTSTNLKISFELLSELSRINNNSPYSLENPIRRIDHIEAITQPKKGLCGQCCVAMLSGVSLEEVINLMGSQCSLGKVIEALNYFGIAHSNKMIYSLKTQDTLPKCCIINTKGHLILFYNGKYYDPSIGMLEELDLSHITGFLEIVL